MRPLTMLGTIDRRILVSYRVDPELAAHIVPAPFRPVVHGGAAVAGICLIRLTELRPRPLPPWLGVTTENVAHRFAVEWDGPGGIERGVFIPRRDTASRLTSAIGGRLFPGAHQHGRFDIDEHGHGLDVRYSSDDGAVDIEVRATETERLPSDSLFASLGDASEFFRQASVGYSPGRPATGCEGVQLRAQSWSVVPLRLESVRSSWFDDETRFPRGSIELDSALLMRHIPAEWIANPAPALAPVDRIPSPA